MRLKELHIYGYGKWSRVSLTNIGKLHIFFGKNEAGKSTMISFVHSILFGFPHKNKSENRYEPKDSSEYGGKIIASTNEGDVTITRVRGKAAGGDVTVVYRDGRTGGEEELARLLMGLDRQTYQAIYSFDLQGISNIHKLKEEDISKYLLSAGLMGNDRLLNVEKQLRQKMEELFKTGGRIPLINKKLSHIKDTYKAAEHAKSEQNTYTRFIDQEKRLAAEQKKLSAGVTRLEEQIATGNHYKAAEPLLIEKRQIEERLLNIGDTHISEELHKQYEEWKQALLPIEMMIASLGQQLDTAENNIQGQRWNEEVLEGKEEIQQAIEQTLKIDAWEHDLISIRHSLQQIGEKVRRLREYANLNVSEERVLELDTSVLMKEKIKSLEKQAQKLDNDLSHLEDKQKTAEDKLAARKQRIAFLEESCLPDEKRAALLQQKEWNEAHIRTKLERQHVEEMISMLEKRKTNAMRSEKQADKKRKRTSMIFVFSCLALGLLSALAGQWLLVIVFAAAVAGIFLFLSFMKPEETMQEMEEELKEWKEKRQHMQQEPYHEEENGLHLLERDNEIRKELDMERLQMKELEEAFDKTVDDFEEWEKRSLELEASIQGILKQWNLQVKGCSTGQLLELYDTFTLLKECIHECKTLLDRSERLEANVDKVKQKVLSLAKRYTDYKKESYQEAVLVLKNEIQAAEQARTSLSEQKRHIRQLKVQIEEQKLKRSHAIRKLMALYAKSDCSGEKEFLAKLRLSEERMTLKQKRDTLLRQLAPYDKEMAKWEQEDEIMNDYWISSKQEKLQSSKRQLTTINEQLNETRHTLRRMEEGGTFDELSFHFNTEKSELDEYAREWAKLALAKHMLAKVMKDYQDDKFPAILSKAEEYIREITLNAYNRLIWAEEDGNLQLQRNDGLIFGADEVSRGTQEAVYVALRLSLAQFSHIEEPMPIIIDDSLVNFDKDRVKHVCHILDYLKNTHQVILFTCHPSFLDLFPDAEKTCLNEISHA
ncbi:MAG: AAA family ATPase [Bacillus sp. (in: firmicutes)]